MFRYRIESQDGTLVYLKQVGNGYGYSFSRNYYKAILFDSREEAEKIAIAVNHGIQYGYCRVVQEMSEQLF